jgi:hypothetical protein
VIDAVAFVLANQNARRTSISVDDAGQKEALNLSFVNDAWWPLVTGLRARTAVSEIDRWMLELCVVIQVANDLKSGDLCIPGSDKFRDYRLQLLSWEEVERELPSYGEQGQFRVAKKVSGQRNNRYDSSHSGLTFETRSETVLREVPSFDHIGPRIDDN